MFMAVEDGLAIVEDPGAVRAHRVDGQDAVDPGAALGPGVDEIRLAVVVPERRRIDPALGLADVDERLPGAARAPRLRHEDAEIGIPVVDPVPAVVAADARR